MSISLYWKPINPDDNYISDINLRDVLIEEGLCPNTLRREHLEFLKGLKAAKIRGAEELIEAILKYGEIGIYAK